MIDSDRIMGSDRKDLERTHCGCLGRSLTLMVLTSFTCGRTDLREHDRNSDT